MIKMVFTSNLLILLLGLLSIPVIALDFPQWRKAENGVFSDPAKWNSGKVPGESSYINFQETYMNSSAPPAGNTPFTVSFYEDHKVDGLSLKGNINLNLELNQHDCYVAVYNVQIGDGASSPNISWQSGTFRTKGSLALKSGLMVLKGGSHITSGDVFSMGDSREALLEMQGGELSVGLDGARYFYLGNNFPSTISYISGKIYAHTYRFGQKDCLKMVLNESMISEAPLKAKYKLIAAGELKFSLPDGFNAEIGNVFRLFKVEGNGGITGGFSNMPSGHEFELDGYTFRVAYGDDITNILSLKVIKINKDPEVPDDDGPDSAAWKVALSGEFSNPENWSGGEAPGKNTYVYFKSDSFTPLPNVSESFSVDFTKDALVRGLRIAGNVNTNFVLNQHDCYVDVYNVQIGDSVASPNISWQSGTFRTKGSLALKSGRMILYDGSRITSGDVFSMGDSREALLEMHGGELSVGLDGARYFYLGNSFPSTIDYIAGKIYAHTYRFGNQDCLKMVLNESMLTEAPLKAKYKLVAAGELKFSLPDGFNAEIGDIFRLLKVEGNGGITGEFSNMPSGHKFELDGYTFRVAYGDDITNILSLRIVGVDSGEPPPPPPPPGNEIIIPLAQTVIDGQALDIQPGDILTLQAGVRPSLLFKNIVGSSDNYVIIRNSGGKVSVGNLNSNNAISIYSSRYVRLTGSGKEDLEYGICVTASKPGTQGVAVSGFSSDIEIDHLEIANAGFAGIMAKTDPVYSDFSADRPNFTMYNVHLHHNYIHDVDGEGIYLGNSFFGGTTVYDNGVLHYPHEVRGVRVYQNRVERTGWDGIQVGCAVDDVEIYDNIVTDYGCADKDTQNSAIQLSPGTTGLLYNNFIDNGSGHGIVIQGIGNITVFNNVIRDAGAPAVNINTRPTPLKTDIVPSGFLGGVYILHNTIIDSKSTGAINEYVNEAQDNVFYNNLIVTDKDNWNQLKVYTDWDVSHNLIVRPESEAGFVNAAEGDYHLLSSSPAIDTGRELSQYGVDTDADGVSRSIGTVPDCGAFEYRAP
ncbi:MAG: hypothetical protein A2X48_12930 [Lentisphaerae bacterium GWF2_49_21]|nr:MAG: hypothetical protein A2X48_12930 [Lentisphaerae bacterium GWF2_49_21]